MARTARGSSAKRATSLLILSSKAGSMTPQIEAKLRNAFAGSLIVEFDPRMDVEKLVSPRATVIVAGGDGTIGWVVRKLAETNHPIGILSLGTFNICPPRSMPASASSRQGDRTRSHSVE